MEFRIDQSRFLSALGLALSVSDKRSSQQMLGNVLLSASADHKVTCSATDSIIAVTDTLEAETTRTGSLSVAAGLLNNVVRTLPSGSLTIERLENNRIQLTSGKATFQIVALSERDFPTLPNPQDIAFFEIPAASLATLIGQTLFSVSTDETRINLNGALLEITEDTITMVSTDGHRLTKRSLPWTGHELGERKLIVPRKGLVEIRRIVDKLDRAVHVAIDNTYFYLRSENVLLSIKLNNVSFPPYQQVIPKSHDRSVRVARQDFLGALKRAEVLAPEKTSTIRLALGANTLELLADNPDRGVAKQEIEVEYEGTALVTGFNAKYLIDALDVITTETAILEFQGELDPCVIRPSFPEDDTAAGESLAIVMPMRI